MSHADPASISNLESSSDRFVAALLGHAHQTERVTPQEFLEQFPPVAIMEALADEPSLRARLLIETTGAHEKIADKKAVASAAEDLELAIAEGVTSADDVLVAFALEDRVRFLDRRQLWALLGDVFSSSEDTVRFVVEQALEHGLLDLPALFDGLTFDEVAAALPEDDLRVVVSHGLREGRRGQALGEVEFLEVVPLGTLLGHLSIEHVWERVVLERVAGPQGWCEAGPASVRSRPESTEVRQEEDSEARPPFEAAARARVVGKLEELRRLPPVHERLSLANLCSLEAMYGDLPDCGSDEEREAVIRDAFPNERQLKRTLLALIELLDPSIDTTEPVIRDADSDALVKVVLFEENLRQERDRRASVTTTPPPSPARRSSVVVSTPPPRTPAVVAEQPSIVVTPPPPPPSRRGGTPPPPPSRRSGPPPAPSQRGPSLTALAQEVEARRAAG